MRGLIGLLLFSLATSTTFAVPRPKLFGAGQLSQSSRDSIKVWIFFRDKGTPRTFQAISQKATARTARKGNVSVSTEAERPVSSAYLRAVERLGGRVWHTSRWLNAASVWITPQMLSAIEQLPFVAGFRPVARYIRRPDPEPSEPAGLVLQKPLEATYADSYGPTITQLDSLNIPIVHTLGYRGDSVLVAMLDDGYRKNHTVFSALYANNQVLAEYDFIQKDSDTAPGAGDSPTQGNHGTSTWSVVGGTVPGSFLGGAYKANFILAKTEYIPAENRVEEDNWVAALEWADSIGADVVSSSLAYLDFDDTCGCDYSFADLDGMTTIVSSAASTAADLGILVCNAAGNNGPPDSSIWAPADAFDVLACGAIDSNGNLASFSSTGPIADERIKPEVVAQGVRTYLANPLNLSGYARGDGTSFSTPLIASASAVLMSVHPDWPPRQIREALMLTASNVGSPNIQRGWGVPDVYKAAVFRPDSTITLEVVREGPVVNVPPGTSSYPVKVVVHNPRAFPVTSPQLFFKEISGSGFSSVPLTPATGDTFTASLTIGSGDREIVFYASANGGVVKDPVFAPAWLYRLPARPWFKSEADLGPFDWNTSGTSLTWGPSGRQSYSGYLSFGDSPRGSYRNNADERWEMRSGVNFNPATNYFLRYFERHALATAGDSVWVEASTDGGLNWTPLPGTRRTGNLSTWTERIVSLGTYVQSPDFRIRFRLKSDASGVADGWFVDDISILPRGDLNGDGLFSAADVVALVNFIFNDVAPPVPLAAADVNGNLAYSGADIVCLVQSVFNAVPCPAP
ncbi:MAG: S8 family serine peptidase [candidate division Zixibacteria bacterium]|nr:S8 family serine peptidase [candidate division Zixibacteria bacterium]